MRRFLAAISITATLAVISAGAPAPGEASCAGTAALEQVASEPGTAVFTGWAARGITGSQDLVFVVDRWFHGRHAAREVRLLGYSAVLAEEEARGPVAVALAEVVAGDAIMLRDGAEATPLQVIPQWWLPTLALALAASWVLALRRLART